MGGGGRVVVVFAVVAVVAVVGGRGFAPARVNSPGRTRRGAVEEEADRAAFWVAAWRFILKKEKKRRQ